MKTTVDIPDEVLEEAIRFSKAGTKREAVLAALEDYNGRHRKAKLVKLLGKSDGFYSDGRIANPSEYGLITSARSSSDRALLIDSQAVDRS